MEAVFTFHNTHGAIHGETLLVQGGLKVRVMALPSALGAGCGLCLRVDADKMAAAKNILAAGKVSPEGVYYKIRQDGQTVYRPADDNS